MMEQNRFEDLAVQHKARGLVISVYRISREDFFMMRDFQLCAMMTKSALELVATLANAAASNQVAYFSRGVGFARSWVAQLKALLESANDVESISEENYALLLGQIVEIQSLLTDLGTAMEKRIIR